MGALWAFGARLCHFVDTGSPFDVETGIRAANGAGPQAFPALFYPPQPSHARVR